MTEQLYLADDTVVTFEATVERTLDDRVVLDRTHFYPTGGGQPHDTGTLRVAEGSDSDGERESDSDDERESDPDDERDETDDRRWRVVDVEKTDTVYHTLEPATDAAADASGASLPAPGTTVVGRIDWDRRRAHARYHTAQHLLSALLLDEYDAQTTGNQLYADHAHLDAAYDRFDRDDLDHIEARLNALVADARPVVSYTMDRDEAEATLDTDRTRIDLLPDSITELRIVEIGAPTAETGGEVDGIEDDAGETESDAGGTESDGDDPYDRTACAGTHVGSTAEIGEVVVTGRETKGGDEERVNFSLAEHR